MVHMSLFVLQSFKINLKAKISVTNTELLGPQEKQGFCRALDPHANGASLSKLTE